MTDRQHEEASLKIGKRTFLIAFIILLLLMITAGILTRVIPTGSYEREIVNGKESVIQNSFQLTNMAQLPVYRWFTAPFEVLFSSDGAVILVIIFFILAVSMAFSLLEKSDIMSLFIIKIVQRFGKMKYLLMAVVVFFFMLLGAVLGTFEENIALVPMIIALAYCMGWDSLVGLGMSLLASCFGFTAAITNPFSIAITQEISDLPLYSGFGYRLVIFAVYYAVVFIFLSSYARKIEKTPEKSLVFGEDAQLRAKYRNIGGIQQMLNQKSPDAYRKTRKAAIVFCVFILLIFGMIVGASLIPGLSDLTLPLIGLLLLVGGLVAARVAGISFRERLKTVGIAAGGIAPGIVLILMAMSVKFIINAGGIMDTILYHTANAIMSTSPYVAILLIYALILFLELFVGSSSAKAFLVMPLIAPLSDLVGITRQTSVLAFCFGDGFSNIIYPTNPVLLICLGLTVITYTKWMKWTLKLQLLSFGLACVFLLIGVAMHYGPF
ncbi:MAG TPA: AbgT family transporter [Candidatus Limiplasma sp.]|nr:AbgT family transporter [Candidatus Limiplasma sp.]